MLPVNKKKKSESDYTYKLNLKIIWDFGRQSTHQRHVSQPDVSRPKHAQ